jgi:hypothetical protein
LGQIPSLSLIFSLNSGIATASLHKNNIRHFSGFEGNIEQMFVGLYTYLLKSA